MEIRLADNQVGRAARGKRRRTLPSEHAIVLRVGNQHVAVDLVDRDVGGRVHPDRIDEVGRVLDEVGLPEYAIRAHRADTRAQNPAHCDHRQLGGEQNGQEDDAGAQARLHGPSFARLKPRLPLVCNCDVTSRTMRSGGVSTICQAQHSSWLREPESSRRSAKHRLSIIHVFKRELC